MKIVHEHPSKEHELVNKVHAHFCEIFSPFFFSKKNWEKILKKNLGKNFEKKFGKKFLKKNGEKV